ncbi:hypothetical protein [Enterococcus rotai]|uniref:hypothetical protein n=1 Tax=Enterococcus rotai TaxID=118060 RepID=UPI0032B60615
MKKIYLSKKNRVLIAFFVFLIPSLLIGAYQAYAALTDRDQKQNDFNISDFQTKIEEEFKSPSKFEPDKDYPKKVSIKNIGKQEGFVRVIALPVITKKKMDGTTILLAATTKGNAPILTIDYNLTDWIDGEDGYFYYKKKLAPSENTASLFTSVKMNQANITAEYEGVNLSFEIKVEGINNTKFAYRDAWWSGKIPTKNPYAEIDSLLKDEVR